jgi:hypothetical protein
VTPAATGGASNEEAPGRRRGFFVNHVLLGGTQHIQDSLVRQHMNCCGYEERGDLDDTMRLLTGRAERVGG